MDRIVAGFDERWFLLARRVPGVMAAAPRVEAYLPAFHPFDRRNPADVELEHQAASTLDAWGDKSCRRS